MYGCGPAGLREVSPSPELGGLVHGGGVELHRHAQSAVHHVVVAVLRAERLVGHLQARGVVHGAVDPRDLSTHARTHADTHRQTHKREMDD